MRVFDARSGQALTYGPQERAAVMAEVDLFLTCLVAEQEVWPGDDLLAPLLRQV
ncbi:MAG: hypothetical protein HOZ81_10475 [Streptomyces sp.]|nr:hypothetical protein [Streptomyces sp.]